MLVGLDEKSRAGKKTTTPAGSPYLKPSRKSSKKYTKSLIIPLLLITKNKDIDIFLKF